MTFNPARLKIGGLVAAFIMAASAAALPLSLQWVNQAREERDAVEQRLGVLRVVLETLLDAETGQRGYVITGREGFLQPYHAALNAMPRQTELLRDRYAGAGTEERRLVTELLSSAGRRLEGLADAVRSREDGGFAAAEAVVRSGHGKDDMARVRAIAAQLTSLETRQQQSLEAALRRKIVWSSAISVASTLLNLLLLASLGTMMQRAIRAGAQATEDARRTSDELARGMAALERRNGEVSTLGEMSRVLQAEMSLVEALEVTSLFAGRLLRGTSGSVYLFRNSADVLELAAGWGDTSPGAATLDPAACWGLRRGQMHRHGGAGALRCRHCDEVDADARRHHLCLPLTAYGEVMGLMHVHAADDGGDPEAVAGMAQAISEQVALALSNAKLRQVLRDQSIRDPLTSLYNRRYMEETLTRELARAQRSGKALSVVVADLDHFKKINDTHGHPAGDAVLRAAARLIAGSVRGSDVACRYGGEEFVLILPDCDRDAAAAKAERLCADLRALALREDGHAIPVTASFGVAASPEDGLDADVLFKAADAAVYRAKETGRNRVVVAERREPATDRAAA